MRLLIGLVFFLHTFLSIAQFSDSKQFFISRNQRSVTGLNNASFFQSSLMDKYDMKYLKLDITAQPLSRFISGSCMYKAVAKQALDTFAIEFKQTMTLDSVYINNIKRTFTRSADHIYVAFSPALPAGTSLDLKFFYNGTPVNGIFSGTDAASGLNFTANVSESYQAREWYPAKQILSDKLDSSAVWVTTDAVNLVGSNGLLRAVVDMPGNKKQFQWSSGYKIAYYLPSFSVANYREYKNYAKPASISPDSILVQHLIANNQTFFNEQKVQLDKTPRYIEKYSELCGLYPFWKEKYGHSQASIGGGMEHQTMSTMHNFDPYLIAHELAHQWFGDNVTCATWNDIWLNESFASYLSILMIEYFPSFFNSANTLTQQLLDVNENVMSQTDGSVYVPLADTYNEGRIFDQRLSYNKGSLVLHNLRFEMQSDTLFYNTLKLYQQRFKDSVATTSDFQKVAEQVSGRNLSEFFTQWIYGEGYPIYSVIYSKQGNDTLVLNVTQTTSVPAVTPLFKGLMEYKIKSAQGDTSIKLNQVQNNQTFKIAYSKAPTGIEVDPNNWVINKVGTIVTAVSNLTPLQAGVTIFPNPATDNISIELPAASFSNLAIFDMQGRLMKSAIIPAGSSLIQQPLNLSSGIYLVKLSGKKGNVVEKILVNR